MGLGRAIARAGRDECDAILEAEGLSRDDIRALREEAAVAGDERQVILCDAALAWDVDATKRCVRAMLDY